MEEGIAPSSGYPLRHYAKDRVVYSSVDHALPRVSSPCFIDPLQPQTFFIIKPLAGDAKPFPAKDSNAFFSCDAPPTCSKSPRQSGNRPCHGFDIISRFFALSTHFSAQARINLPRSKFGFVSISLFAKYVANRSRSVSSEISEIISAILQKCRCWKVTFGLRRSLASAA